MTRQGTFPSGEAVIEKPGERVLIFLDRIQAGRIFDTPAHRKDFLRTLTPEQFTNLTTGLDRALLGKKYKVRGPQNELIVVKSYDRETKAEKGINFVPAVREDAPALLRDVCTEAREMPLQNAGLLFAIAMPTIHPFIEGNIRTGRLMFRLLVNGYTGSQEDKESIARLLNREAGYKESPVDLKAGIFITAHAVEKFLTEDTPFSKLDLYEAQIRYNPTVKFSNDVTIPHAVAMRLSYILKESAMAPNILFEYLKSKNKLVEPFFSFSDNKPVFDLSSILAASSEDDLRSILEVERELKKTFVYNLVAACKDPELSSYFLKKKEDDVPSTGTPSPIIPSE